MTVLIEVMLKKQQHVKAVKYVCAFGLRHKFQPASILKDLLKNAEETANTWRENSDYPVNEKVISFLLLSYAKFMSIFVSVY